MKLRAGCCYALLLTGVAFLVFGPSLRAPYVQDDWMKIAAYHRLGFAGFIVEAFDSPFSVFYRPMIGLTFASIYGLFGDAAWGYHLVFLAAHVAIALFISKILFALSGNALVSRLTGVLYAGSATLLQDVFWWCSGETEIGCAFFFFLSLLLFMRGRRRLSALPLLISILYKEAGILLPLLYAAGLYLLADSRPGFRAWVRDVIRSLWPHALVLALYAYIKVLGTSPLALPEHHPYHASLAPEDLLGTGILYLAWFWQAFFHIPESWIIPHRRTWAAITGFLLLLVFVLRFRAAPAADSKARDRFLFLALWAGLTLAPPLLLVNHPYRYYMLYAFPAVAALLLLALSRLAPPRVWMGLVALAVLTEAGYLRSQWRAGLHQPYVSGTNMLIPKGVTVTLVRDGLRKYCPRPPPGSVLIFAELNTSAFQGNWGAWAIYRDHSLRVHTLDEVRRDEAGLFIKAKRLVWDSGARPTYERDELALSRDKTFAFSLRGDRLAPLRWNDLARYARPSKRQAREEAAGP